MKFVGISPVKKKENVKKIHEFSCIKNNKLIVKQINKQIKINN
jgi:hypothetical protein